jgi:hypothetical protein
MYAPSPKSPTYSAGVISASQVKPALHNCAQVASVDTSHHPPSFTIELQGGIFRETEAPRLQPRLPGSAAPATSSPGPATPQAQRAAAPAATFAVPLSMASEREALLVAVEGQLHPAATSSPTAAAAAAGPEPPSAAVAELALRGLAYCWQQLSHRQWTLLLGALTSGLGSCCTQLEGLAGNVAAAVAQGAAAVAGADLGPASAAVQFWRRLQQKGVVERSQKVGDC